MHESQLQLAAKLYSQLPSCQGRGMMHLQVSPLKWPAERNRAVLDRALTGEITDDAISDAAAAIEDGYQGTLARCVLCPAATLLDAA